MSLFDVALLIALGSFVFFGIHSGLIHSLGALLGVVIGAFVSTHYATALVHLLYTLTGIDMRQWSAWVVFLLIFIVVARLVGLLFWVAEKFLKLLTAIPFLQSVNKSLGGVVGFFEGAFIIGLSLVYARYLPVPQLVEWVNASRVAPALIRVANVLLPLVPEAVKNATKYL